LRAHRVVAYKDGMAAGRHLASWLAPVAIRRNLFGD
jgi:hypothetical protein